MLCMSELPPTDDKTPHGEDMSGVSAQSSPKATSQGISPIFSPSSLPMLGLPRADRYGGRQVRGAERYRPYSRPADHPILLTSAYGPERCRSAEHSEHQPSLSLHHPPPPPHFDSPPLGAPHSPLAYTYNHSGSYSYQAEGYDDRRLYELQHRSFGGTDEYPEVKPSIHIMASEESPGPQGQEGLGEQRATHSPPKERRFKLSR